MHAETIKSLTFKLFGSIRTLMASTGNMSFAGKAKANSQRIYMCKSN